MPQPFYLRQRPDRGNKWYVCYPLPTGKQSNWKCTGTTNRAEAERWAEEHNPAAVPHIDKRGFALFAAGWFEPGHEWVKRQEARGHSLSPTYLEKCRGVLKKHVLPQWRLRTLEDITTAALDDWLFALKDKGLSSSTINTCLSIIRVMFKYATRKGYVKNSPAVECERMVGGGRTRGILTIPEAKELFDEKNFDRLWRGNVVMFAANLLGASAGLRIGEVQGLQVKHIKLDDVIPHVEIRQSWKGKYGLGTTKTKGSVRDVPLPSLTCKYLRLVVDGKFPDDLVFPGDDEHRTHGAEHEQAPIDAKWINKAFQGALKAADIDDFNGAAGARWLTFHSHRHYYVSIMRGKLPEHLLRALTGHATVEMSNLYTHTALSDVAVAAAIQDTILSADKQGNEKSDVRIQLSKSRIRSIKVTKVALAQGGRE
jgi:integrase